MCIGDETSPLKTCATNVRLFATVAHRLLAIYFTVCTRRRVPVQKYLLGTFVLVPFFDYKSTQQVLNLQIQRHTAVTLQWAWANGCDWDVNTCTAAAGGGHLVTLQWARANGCPWSVQATSGAAAGGGHLAVLQWLRASRVSFSQSGSRYGGSSGSLGSGPP